MPWVQSAALREREKGRRKEGWKEGRKEGRQNILVYFAMVNGSFSSPYLEVADDYENHENFQFCTSTNTKHVNCGSSS
jgi:hypothetical protein